MPTMVSMLQALNAVLSSFDTRADLFDEHSVAHAVGGLAGPESSIAFQAEGIAFGVAEASFHSSLGKGTTYYGPLHVRPADDGSGRPVEFPNLERVTPNILAYWQKRAAAAQHPVLKIRYADLLWDFSPPVLGAPAPAEVAWTLIDATLALLARDLPERPSSLIAKAKRALTVALALGDRPRVARLAAAVIDLEDRIAEDLLPGLWGFSFEMLVENPRVGLAPAQEAKVIGELEDRLRRVSTEGSPSFDVFATERAVERLLRYYHRTRSGRVDDALDRYEHALRVATRAAEPLSAAAWLAKAEQVLRQEGKLERAKALGAKAREYTAKARAAMERGGAAARPEPGAVEAHLDSFTSGSLEQGLSRIALEFLPRKDRAARAVQELAQADPVQGLARHQILDRRGMPLASVGPLRRDEPGHVVRRIAAQIHHDSPFLTWAFDRAWERYPQAGTGLVQEFVLRSPVFQGDGAKLVELGLRAYFEARWVECLCVLIPAIEGCVRRHVELLGGPVYRSREGGGYRLRALEELLRDPLLEAFWGSDDIPLYLQILFTDARGWDLQQELAHGELAAGRFTRQAADRVLHSLLLLSHVGRASEVPGREAPSASEMATVSR
jgi:tetratricopeptide (TPR) repeat protein